jgi:phage terminase large subunit-like protein
MKKKKASRTVSKPVAKKKFSRAPAIMGPMPWWGNRDDPPHVRWPGVTIEIPVKLSGKQWTSPKGEWVFDMDAANNAEKFFKEVLVHHIGEWAGMPFELLPYQKMLLTRPIFGWKSAVTTYRRFRKVFGFIAKGGGKSPWAAGTGLYCLTCDNEEAAEVYVAAGDREQARIIHDNSKIMVELSPDLSDECQIFRDSIYHAQSHSTFKVLSAEASTKHGFRPHCTIFDEFHAQKNRDLYEALRKSMAKRRQPLMILVSHAGVDDEGICHEEYAYAKKILLGTVPDATTLPVIFEMTSEDDWTSPDVWKRVNPGHGVTIKHEAVEAECHEAMAEPRKRNDFLRFHGNMWTNQAVAWLPIEWWDRCNRIPELNELKKYPVAAGLDGAQKIDLASFVVVFREPLENEVTEVDLVAENSTPQQKVVKKASLNFRLHVLPRFWIPENTMKEREKQDRVPYSLWREMGFVKATRGDTIDYDVITADIREMVEMFPGLKESQIGYDPAFMDDVAQRLIGADKENPEIPMVEVLQNYKYLSEPSQIFEALLKAKRVSHDGNKTMRWNVECVSIKTDDASRIRPVKQRNSTKRIDGVVATVMGVSRLMFAPEPGSTDSVYESRGALVI